MRYLQTTHLNESGPSSSQARRLSVSSTHFTPHSDSQLLHGRRHCLHIAIHPNTANHIQPPSGSRRKYLDHAQP
ncbi:hypothetical protein NMY22_g3036 [Coprinellus aureogranulatus]|nr:hypothetical protein NMY22_g3036 [Coprinellus aureogranulatus]